MLEARDLACVRGERSLFAHMNLTMRPGDYCELRGPNGSGKTSLLRMLCGLLPPARGMVLWDGEPIEECREKYLSSITYVGHRPAIKPDLTALENLRFSAAVSGWALTTLEARAVLDRMGLSMLESLRGRQLSEGQQRRLALARLVACPSTLWLLDEVLASLDAAALDSIVALLDQHLSNGGMAIVATHQPLGLTRRHSHRIELAAA